MSFLLLSVSWFPVACRLKPLSTRCLAGTWWSGLCSPHQPVLASPSLLHPRPAYLCLLLSLSPALPAHVLFPLRPHPSLFLQPGLGHSTWHIVGSLWIFIGWNHIGDYVSYFVVLFLLVFHLRKYLFLCQSVPCVLVCISSTQAFIIVRCCSCWKQKVDP